MKVHAKRHVKRNSSMRLKRLQRGLTAVEYAICGALVGGALIIAFTDLGTAVTGQIEQLTCAVQGKTFTAADGENPSSCN